MATASDSSNKQPSGSVGRDGDNGSLSGLRFNQTGREETAREVLKPQRDPAAGKRVAAIIAIVVLGLTVVGAITFQRSGFNPLSVFKSDDDHKVPFAAPASGE